MWVITKEILRNECLALKAYIRKEDRLKNQWSKLPPYEVKVQINYKVS